MRDLDDRQALALHLVHILVCSHTLPSERATRLTLLAETAPALAGDDFAALRVSIAAMLLAQTHVQWIFARMDTERALARLHTAWAAVLISDAVLAGPGGVATCLPPRI